MTATVVVAKYWLKSRTVWVNMVSGLSAAVAALSSAVPAVQQMLTPKMFLTLTAVLAALNIWMRFSTEAPLRVGPVPDDGSELGDPTKREKRDT